MAALLDANAAAPLVNDPQPRLPPEICERIIDHLDPRWHGNERVTLLNCVLVCRGWYVESRAVLFEEPELRSRKGAVVCVTSLKQMPLLAARVRQLQIGHYSDSKTIMTGPELASILVMLAGKLLKLASFNFYSVSFERCPTHNLALWSLHEFSHITSLGLLNVTLPSASTFFQLTCSFPRLQELFCHHLHWSKSRSVALALPEHHRVPLRTVTALCYDLSCFEDIGNILLSLLDQAILEDLTLRPIVSAAHAFTQGMLSIAGTRLEQAMITFRTPDEDDSSNIQPLLYESATECCSMYSVTHTFQVHPISFETNVNLQHLEPGILDSEMNDVALFVGSVLLPLLKTISSKDLKDIRFLISSVFKWETHALLNAFDPKICIQIDELLAEGHSAKLRDVFIDFYSRSAISDGSQRVDLHTEICVRFPKLNDKSMLTIHYNGHRFASDAERELKSKQLANQQLHSTEQAAT